MNYKLVKMKQSWKLLNKETLKTHEFLNIKDLKLKCDAIILDGINDNFKILYFEDYELEDEAEISDYFDVDNIQSN